MSNFTSKFSLGQTVKFSMPREVITGTIWSVTFTEDMQPKYQIEALNDRKWTESYFDIFEDALEVTKSGETK